MPGKGVARFVAATKEGFKKRVRSGLTLETGTMIMDLSIPAQQSRT
jgi:hypothetical protein